MKIHKYNMWDIYNEADYFLFTGNSYIKNNGALVMGRGMAKQVLNKFPHIDKKLGFEIKSSLYSNKYGLIILGKIGIFQVKKHFASDADLKIIKHSVKYLNIFARTLPKKQIYMNYPGIGYGRRTQEEIFPIIKRLPNNVHICLLEGT